MSAMMRPRAYELSSCELVSPREAPAPFFQYSLPQTGISRGPWAATASRLSITSKTRAKGNTPPLFFRENCEIGNFQFKRTSDRTASFRVFAMARCAITEVLLFADV